MKKSNPNALSDLAGDLHNGVCQTLTGVQLHASVLTKRLKKTCPEFSAEMEELEKLIGRARGELHEVVQKLR